MSMTTSTTVPNGSNPLITSWNIGAAMRNLYDTCEAGLLPYVLLGEAARQLHDGIDGYNGNDLKVSKLEWGIPASQLTPEVVSLFHQWDFKETDYGFSYMFEEVPVEVHIFQKKYRFFKMPDMRFYGPDLFKIPNEFEKYWFMRHMVK